MTTYLERLSKTLWLSLIPVCLACAVFYSSYQSKIFPTISQPITLSQQDAEKMALDANSSIQLGLDSKTVQTASAYISDRSIQNYVTLEGGGNDELNSLITDGKLVSANWAVRLYIPKEIQENHFYFTPNGEFDGFRILLAEDKKLPNISKDEAEQNIRTFITTHPLANTVFAEYTVKDYKSNQQVNGRLDHTFVFENKNARIHEAVPELTARISGNQLTEVTTSYKIPENFIKNFNQMYSYNKVLGSVGFMIIVLGYMGIAITAVIYAWREHQLDWTHATIIALGIAILTTLSSLNYLPLSWYFNYQTSRNPLQFLLEQTVPLISQTIINFSYLAITFLAAEYLTRKAFPEHPLLWNWLSSKQVRSSVCVKQVAMGYVIFFLDLGYIASFYLTALQIPGVWSPSFNLIDPNIIASYVPFFSPFANSIHAGVWEECLFRAVPIATAAILGRYYKKPMTFISVALVLQAVIFGLAHANYPQQPSYIRIIELSIPFFFWGLAYVHFGLLPGIIAHYLFDVFVMSESLFFIDTPYIWIQQVAVVICIALPILAVLVQRLRFNSLTAWDEIDTSERNSHWTPPTNPTITSQKTPFQSKAVSTPGLLILGAISLLSLGSFAWFYSNTVITSSRITISKSQALQIAAQTAPGFLNMEKPWDITAQARNTYGTKDSSDYLIDKLGSKKAQLILGTREIETTEGTTSLDNFLPQTIWDVRYANFSGDQDARSERLHIFVRCANKPPLFSYKQSENAPGNNLSEQDAQATTMKKLLELGVIEKENSRKWDYKSIKSVTQPSGRIDWHIALQNIIAETDEVLIPNIFITVSGDKVTSVSGNLFIPEAWQENYNEEQGLLSILQGIIALSLIGYLVILFQGIRAVSHGDINLRMATKVFTGLMILSLLSSINMIPQIRALLSPSTPVLNQLFTTTSFALVAAVVINLMVTVGLGYILFIQRGYTRLTSATRSWVVGLLMSIIFFSCFSLATKYSDTTHLLIPNVEILNSYSPLFSMFSGNLMALLSLTLFCVGICGWAQKNPDTITSFTLGGFVLMCQYMSNLSFSTPSQLLITSGLFIIVAIISYLCIYRYDISSLVGTAGGIILLRQLDFMLVMPYPAAGLHELTAIIVLLGGSYLLTVLLQAHQRRSSLIH